MLRPLVGGFQVVDPHTVTVRLRFAAPVFLETLASAWCRVVARHVLERYGDLTRPEAQVGTGPFRLKRYEQGSLIEWARNPDYYRRGLPYLDGVRQFVLVGTARQLAAAKAAQVMLSGATLPMTRVQAEELKRARPEVDLYVWPLNTLSMVHLNAARPRSPRAISGVPRSSLSTGANTSGRVSTEWGPLRNPRSTAPQSVRVAAHRGGASPGLPPTEGRGSGGGGASRGEALPDRRRRRGRDTHPR